MQRALKYAPALLTAVLMAACSASPPAPPATTTSAPTISVTPIPAGKRDRDDPDKWGCTTSAVSLPHAVPVNLPGGQKYGDLTLRFSKDCGTIWARVENVTKLGVHVHLELTRPKDGITLVLDLPKTADKSPFSHMLRYERGCILAIAQVNDGPTAKTSCSQG